MVLCMQSKLCQKDLQQQQLERERALLHLRPSCQRLGGYNAAWWLQTATHVHNLGWEKGPKSGSHCLVTCTTRSYLWTVPSGGGLHRVVGGLVAENILLLFLDHHQ